MFRKKSCLFRKKAFIRICFVFRVESCIFKFRRGFFHELFFFQANEALRFIEGGNGEIVIFFYPK